MSADDIVEVIATINRYAFAVDSLQWDLFDQVFTTDTHADFGGGAAWSDLASLKQAFEAIHRPFKATQHVTTNHNVTVKGDTAHSFTYVIGHFIRDVPEGGTMFRSGGWYDDMLVRTADGWRIKVRNCKSIWCDGNPTVLQSAPEVPVEMELFPLSTEAAAGRIAYLKALTGRS